VPSTGSSLDVFMSSVTVLLYIWHGTRCQDIYVAHLAGQPRLDVCWKHVFYQNTSKHSALEVLAMTCCVIWCICYTAPSVLCNTLTESQRSADRSLWSSAIEDGARRWHRYSTTTGCTRRWILILGIIIVTNSILSGHFLDEPGLASSKWEPLG